MANEEGVGHPGVVQERGLMVYNFRTMRWSCGVLYAVGLLMMAYGCSSEHYKAEADKEVYSVIDSKWQGSFGQKANYMISDLAPSPNDIRIERVVPKSGVMSLAQVVAMATAHNRDYQGQKEQLYLTALDLTLERHQFARQWFGTFDARYVRSPGENTGGDDNEEKLSYDAGLGFEQMLADGAEIGVGIALDWARFLTGDPRTTLSSVLTARVVQPLLRGSGRKIAQENLTQAERRALYQIRAFNRFRKTFVVSIVTDYYRILQQKDGVTNALNNYERRVESRKRLEMEADAGRTPRFQVDQAEQRELDARDLYVRSQQRYQQLLDEFKIRLSLATEAKLELDENELKALENVGVSTPDYTLHTAIDTALLQRLDLANSRDQIDDAMRKAVVAADSLGAELNLVGSASVGSTEKTDFTRLEFHRGNYALGFESDLPLDRKAERNAYREALIALEQREREYENDMDEVKLEVRQAHRELEEAAERYRIQNNSLELAKKRVESTTILLEAGRLSTRDLLESQDALLRAQDDVTAALVDHAIAKLNFFRDVGILQVRPDGMWEQ